MTDRYVYKEEEAGSGGFGKVRVNFDIDYDPKADVLYCSFGVPVEAISKEITDGVFVRVDPKTNQTVGVTIIDFSRRFTQRPVERVSLLLNCSLIRCPAPNEHGIRRRGGRQPRPLLKGCRMANEIEPEWKPISAAPENRVLRTKIDDQDGIRNDQNLIRRGRLWFFPDWSMYVYYSPTHWTDPA